MDGQAKFKYSASEGILELEGSEDFVTKHFESITDMVRIISRHTNIEQKQKMPSQNAIEVRPSLVDGENTESSKSGEPTSHYPKYFSEINGKLKLVAAIPGLNAKSKMTNAALLFCYGSKLLGDEQVSSKEIRAVCEEHGCLDTGNFSKVFSDRTLFISDGAKGGLKEVKLTFQGEEKAKELLSNGRSSD
jgi:hypothetical protein